RLFGNATREKTGYRGQERCRSRRCAEWIPVSARTIVERHSRWLAPVRCDGHCSRVFISTGGTSAKARELSRKAQAFCRGLGVVAEEVVESFDRYHGRHDSGGSGG